jgi:hypothetical protein
MKQLFEICRDLHKKFEAVQSVKYFGLRTIFDDFCTIAMASYHNSLYSLGKLPVPAFYQETRNRLKREYADTLAKYKDSNAFDLFADILAVLAQAMHDNPYDYLGKIYMDANISNKCHGQVFYAAAYLRTDGAQMTIGSKEAFEVQVAIQGFVGASDPCCGSDAMAVALIKVLERTYGVRDVDAKLYIELINIDYACVRMAFINMAILGLSVQVIWGDALAGGERTIYDTPCMQIALAQGRFQTRENQPQHKQKEEER